MNHLQTLNPALLFAFGDSIEVVLMVVGFLSGLGLVGAILAAAVMFPICRAAGLPGIGTAPFLVATIAGAVSALLYMSLYGESMRIWFLPALLGGALASFATLAIAMSVRLDRKRAESDSQRGFRLRSLFVVVAVAAVVAATLAPGVQSQWLR